MPRFPQPSAVPMTKPSTSPMAQPVRQCVVALAASRLSDFPPCGDRVAQRTENSTQSG